MTKTYRGFARKPRNGEIWMSKGGLPVGFVDDQELRKVDLRERQFVLAREDKAIRARAAALGISGPHGEMATSAPRFYDDEGKHLGPVGIGIETWDLARMLAPSTEPIEYKVGWS